MKQIILSALAATILTGCTAFSNSTTAPIASFAEGVTSPKVETKTIINVADHGILPGKDVTRQVNELITSFANTPNVTLIFPKGQYDFHPEYALEKYRDVANHDNSLKRMAFPIFGHSNITIDGDGSLFMFHGRIVPFTVDQTNTVTLKNFTIDFIRPFHAELNIVESNKEENSFIVEIDPDQYPYKVEKGELLFERFGQIDPIGSNMVFDPKTRSPIYSTRQYHVSKNSTKVTKLDGNQVQFNNASKTPPPVGSVLAVYGAHPTSRLVPGIHITDSKDVKLDNITVLAAGGMALIVERTENIHLDGFTVTSGKNRIVATRADATHFIGCKGTILMENSVVEHMLDDGINVHGAYVNIDEYIGKNQFLASISHFQQMNFRFGDVGDEVAMLSRETVLPFFETKIKSIKQLNEKRFVITLDNVPSELPKGPLSLENLTWNPDLIMRNNKIQENRARSVLVTTKGSVLIEKNVFNSQMHGILIEGDNKFWYESGAVKDVTIQNNTFINSGFGGEAAYPLLASPMLTPEQRIGEGHYHSNIKFNDNKLIGFNGLLVKSLSVDGLEIKGNILEFSKDYPEIKEYPSIDISYSKNAVIANNKAKGFDYPLEIRVSEDSEDFTILNNEGFSQ